MVGPSRDEDHGTTPFPQRRIKRRVAQEYLFCETLHGSAERHDSPRNLVRVWVQKYEADAFDNDAADAMC